MSNIHGFRDYRNQDNNRVGGANYSSASYGTGMGQSIPFLSMGRGNSGDPRKETIGDMLRNNCCPSLGLNSFTFLITVVNISVFVVTLAVGGICVTAISDFLQPSPSTLDSFGGLDPYQIQQGQVFRFLSPVVLHGGFLHITFNTISLLILGTMVESSLKFNKMAILYIMAGIGGNLFSAFTQPNSFSIGASSSISGLVGFFVGFLIMNWKNLDYPGSPRCAITCFVGILVFMNIVYGAGLGFSQTGSSVNNMAHIGGLIAGIFVSMIIVNPMSDRITGYEKNVVFFGWVLSIIYFVGGMLYFFLGVTTAPLSFIC